MLHLISCGFGTNHYVFLQINIFIFVQISTYTNFMKNPHRIILFFLLFLTPCFGFSQIETHADFNTSTGFSPSKDKYVKDSAFFSLGNTFGQNWFQHKIFRAHERNEAGYLVSASDYEYDTIGLNWFEQKRYEGTFTNPIIQKSWLSYIFDKSTETWRMSDSIAFNANGSPTYGWFKLWDPVRNKFVSGQLTDYFYSNEGELHLAYNKFYDTISGDWQKDYYKVIYKNSYGRDSIRGFFKWSESTQDWVDSLMITYSYDDKHHLLGEIHELWVDGNWENSKKWEYFYAGQNILDEQFEYRWDAALDDWDYKGHTEFEYYENKDIKTITDYFWDGYEWYNKTRVSYSYQGNSLPTEILNEYWSFGFNDWANSSLAMYDYDANNNRLTYTFKIWNEDQEVWRNFYKEENFWSFFEYHSIDEKMRVNFSLYPNPASGRISITMDEKIQPIKDSELRIFAPDGRLVYTQKLHYPNETVDVSKLTPGNYLLILQTNKGSGSRVLIVK